MFEWVGFLARWQSGETKESIKKTATFKIENLKEHSFKIIFLQGNEAKGIIDISACWIVFLITPVLYPLLKPGKNSKINFKIQSELSFSGN